jgi:DMSO/TMAO reductase YedYZ molybdopterin-dependent catalytic subunit
MDERREGKDAGAGTGPEAQVGGPGTAGAARGVASDAAGRDQSAPPMSMRYSRRRLLILGGSFAAGVVAVIAGLRAFGGTAATKVSSAISDQFGPFPVRSVEDVPDVPADQWQVKVDGLVDQPFTLDRATWDTLERTQETVDFNCVEGWTVANVRWAGVPPSVLLDKAGVKPEGAFVVVHAESGKYLSTLPIDLMRDPQTMLADELNGEALPLEHGGPLRLVVPVQLGYKNVKWVTRLEVTDTVRTGYWEHYGYPEDAPVLGG